MQRSLAIFVLSAVVLTGAALNFAAAETPNPSAGRPIDDAQVRAAGIRKLEGHRLTLYTDLPPAPAIDDFPIVFEKAFPQWCEYFHVDPKHEADWHITGFV